MWELSTYNGSNVFLTNIPYKVWTTLVINTNANVTMSNSSFHQMTINFGSVPAGHNATLTALQSSGITAGTVFNTSYGLGKFTAVGSLVTFATTSSLDIRRD